jgi:rod shape-determining protein MreD
MATLIAIPILAMLLMLQSAILSRFPLLNGTSDLVLLAIIAWALQKRVRTAWQWGIIGGLMVGLVSALPFGVPLIVYPASVGMALLLRQRVWQVPILAMFIATFFATLLAHLVMMIALRISGIAFSWQQAINVITLPTIILNLLLAIPVYALFADLAKWLHPEPLEV